MTREQEHGVSVRAILELIRSVARSEGRTAAFRYVYAHHDAGLIFLKEETGQEPTYNFAQGRADDIITPSLAK